MVIYDNQITKETLSMVSHFLPSNVQAVVTSVIESGLTSQFHCKIDIDTPTTNVYLVERNDFENYTMCHLFSFDLIGSDFSFHSLHGEQIKNFIPYISHLYV